jgi:hypothetical protein
MSPESVNVVLQATLWKDRGLGLQRPGFGTSSVAATLPDLGLMISDLGIPVSSSVHWGQSCFLQHSPCEQCGIMHHETEGHWRPVFAEARCAAGCVIIPILQSRKQRYKQVGPLA